MNISTLTLRDLEYLVSVEEQGHFGRAAAACHVSQPALSSQIKKIEDFLKIRIFERDRRQVRVTDKGRKVVAQARAVLKEAQGLVTLAQETAKPLEGPLRLGAIATLGPYLLPHLIAPLKKAFPKMELILKEGLTDELLSDLRTGTLDAVLAARTFNEASFHVQRLFREPFVVLVPKDHRLADSNPVRVQDLNAGEMVLLEDGHCLRDEVLDICPSNRRGQVRQYHATSLETLRYLVANGAGYTFMPLLAVRPLAQLKNLVSYHVLNKTDVGRDIVLVTRAQFVRAKETELLSAKIREVLPDVEFEGLKLKT